ncbi:MAG: ADP-dependent glucokinase/phosphofructokinase [Treponema sp.]|jgi:ADP-dependent phosphofructokinase/glucokinase|nr:ADP-dependent glucokinase/phosphofructokinase [Treponema sp.]
MAYIDRYEYYLEHVSADMERYRRSGKWMVFGYTSNYDVIIRWDVRVFNRIAAEYLTGEPSFKEGEVINSVEDFVRVVSFCAIHGLGGEIDIVNSRVCDFIESVFATGSALGGTGAQGAAALGAMGFPLILHITDRSKEVCEKLNYPGLVMVSGDTLIPVMEGARDTAPVRHLIMQYSKDDVLELRGARYTIPLSNRLIMDYDTVHKSFLVDREFLGYLESHADSLVSYSVSGFNAFLDSEVLRRRLEELRIHYGRIKAASRCTLYLEGAHYLNPKIRHLTFGMLAESVDILGMNGEELADLTKDLGQGADGDSLESVLAGLELILETYSVRGVVMHTGDYSLYYGAEPDCGDMEKGLTLGNIMSATRARTGSYGTRSDCEKTLSVPLSPAGVSFARELESVDRKRYACLVPSRYMENPKYTIGLGDTFVAGMQIGFIC